MTPGSFLGLSLIVGICLAGVVAQQYWVAPPDHDDSSQDDLAADYSAEYADYVPYSSYGGGGGGGGPVVSGPPASSSEERDSGLVYVPPGAYPIPGPGDYWAEERARDGWGKDKKKKKKKKSKKKKKCKKKGKKGKKKKGCEKKGGWGPVTVSTSGVQVGWKGWIPPVKGAGWGWFGEKSGHFSFTDKGGWGKRPGPHFPDPGPPTFIKHGPIHHKVIHQQKGWGGWHKK